MTAEFFCEGGAAFKNFRRMLNEDCRPKLLCRGVCCQDFSGEAVARITGEKVCAGDEDVATISGELLWRGSCFEFFFGRSGARIIGQTFVQGDLVEARVCF